MPRFFVVHSQVVLTTLALAGLVVPGPVRSAQPRPKPLRVLLITGGCYHNYAAQKDLLKKDLEARAHVVADQIRSNDRTPARPRPLHHYLPLRSSG